MFLPQKQAWSSPLEAEELRGAQAQLSLDKAACDPLDTEYAVLDMQLWASHQETTEIS